MSERVCEKVEVMVMSERGMKKIKVMRERGMKK